MSKELRDFYKGRAKKPNQFTYDGDGNLVILDSEGAVTKTIALPSYRRPTYEEIDEMEKKRETDIAIANKEYEDLKIELRNAGSNPEIPDSEILRLNRKVKEADIKLLATRFPLRFINVDYPIEISKIDFSQPNEKRKYPYDFYSLETRPFTLNEQYIRIGKEPVKPFISVAEIKEAEQNRIQVILFYEPDTNDYGFLSLKWVVEIEFNRTMYNSAHQALYAEIAKGFNDQENLEKIMLAETPDEITYALNDVPGDPDINGPKWNDMTKQLLYDINIAKFKQYPELTARLLDTQNAQLGAYEPNDTLIGIGISLDNIQSKNPINWTGQNLLGKVLMDIRHKIRSERETEIKPIIPDTVRKPRRRPIAATSIQPLTGEINTIKQEIPVSDNLILETDSKDDRYEETKQEELPEQEIS